MPTITAKITDVQLDANTGWYRISTSDTNIKRLDTKRRDKAEQAFALLNEGVLAELEYTERPGNINPHTGNPFLNRYYENGLPAQAAAPPSDIPVMAQTSRKTDPEDAWRICLAAGGKLAVATLPLMEQRSFEAQKQVAYAWAEYFYFTPPPQAFGNSPAGLTPSPVFAGADGNDYADYGTPAPGDDDIPF